jgi:hypothetical protein
LPLVMQPIGVVFEGVVGAEIAEFVAVIDRPVNRDFQLEREGELDIEFDLWERGTYLVGELLIANHTLEKLCVHSEN